MLTTISWSSCDRIISGIDPPNDVLMQDIPNVGSTPLPVLLGKEVVVRMDKTITSDDSRGKTTTVPAPQVNGAELRTMVTQVANALDAPYLAVFGLRDTLDAQWRYAYTRLNFDEDIVAAAGGKRVPFIYTRVSDQGIQEVVAALIPDTPAAGRAIRSWLRAPKPQERPMETSDNTLRKKVGDAVTASNYDCGMDGQYDCVILTWEDGNITLMCFPKMCLWANSSVEQHDDGLGSGPEDGPICRDFPELCESDSGFTSDIPSYTDCNGVLNGLAYIDPVCPGRCVGGTTGRLPAPAGADCNTLKLPCAGDVVKNPEITSSGNSGKTGGRFRPCVGASCPEELRAVRIHPRTGELSPHTGLDITCTDGNPIYAPVDMDGIERGYQANVDGSGYGYFVRGWTTIDGVRHSFGFAHLKQTGRASGSVNKGDVIGYCGRSGIPNTPDNRRIFSHVHLELGTQPVFVSGNRASLRNPELVLATRFSQDSTATPINANPCGQ